MVPSSDLNTKGSSAAAVLRSVNHTSSNTLPRGAVALGMQRPGKVRQNDSGARQENNQKRDRKCQAWPRRWGSKLYGERHLGRRIRAWDWLWVCTPAAAPRAQLGPLEPSYFCAPLHRCSLPCVMLSPSFSKPFLSRLPFASLPIPSEPCCGLNPSAARFKCCQPWQPTTTQK